MASLPTAVICAAGRGTRMGQGRPKCLTPILGRPLIHWQLEALVAFPELIVVVGFQSQAVIDAVRSIRSNAVFVSNPEFETTGTAASLSLAMRQTRNTVISIDGDLLVRPEDILALASTSVPAIGVCGIQSLAPVVVTLDTIAAGSMLAKAFYHMEPAPQDANVLEWTGLVTIDPRVHPVCGKGHVYQMIASLLPCPAVQVQCREIDFPSEVPLMEDWLRAQIDAGSFHG